jgi:hypothetical protein
MSEAQHKPVAGQDYPRTWSQFEDWFASEIDCLRYLDVARKSGAAEHPDSHDAE